MLCSGGLDLTLFFLMIPGFRAQDLACGDWTWEDGGGTLTRSMVIPGNDNISMSIHPRGHLLFCLVGNVLRHDVMEATPSFRVQRPPATGEASCPIPMVQVTRLLLHSKCRAGESGIGRKPWGDSLGLEGYDFEVDTKSFSVRGGGKTSQVSRKASKDALAKWLICQIYMILRTLVISLRVWLKNHTCGLWLGKNKKIIHLIFIFIRAEKCSVWKSHPSKVENHTRQADMVTVLSEIQQ